MDVDVLCINCQNMIKADLVQRHSQVCLVVLPSVLALEAGSHLRLLNFKTDKLKCALEAVDAEGALPDSDMALVNRLIHLCVGLLLCQTEPERCIDVGKEIETLLGNFTGGLAVRLYSERLRALAQEKGTELRAGESEDVEASLERHKVEAEQLKQQVEYYRKQTSSLQTQFARNNVEEIDSQVGRGSRHTSESQSDAEDDFETQERQVQTKSSEELQRYFYSQCLQVKMTLSARDPAQAVPLPSLYQKAQLQKVPVDQWPDFIRTELLHNAVPRPS
jgi:hypothetical protein